MIPWRSASICRGTIFAWCSAMLTSTWSPRLKIWLSHKDCAKRLYHIVALLVEIIREGDVQTNDAINVLLCWYACSLSTAISYIPRWMLLLDWRRYWQTWSITYEGFWLVDAESTYTIDGRWWNIGKSDLSETMWKNESD